MVHSTQFVSSPNPKKLSIKLTLESVDRYKRYRCVHYVVCLSQASRENWPQFHCNACDIHEEEEADLEDFGGFGSAFTQD